MKKSHKERKKIRKTRPDNVVVKEEIAVRKPSIFSEDFEGSNAFTPLKKRIHEIVYEADTFCGAQL